MKPGTTTYDYSIAYSDPLRTTMTHLKSGTEVVTDAPVDNRGLGQAFSPTDLVSAALASCILTIMGIRIKDENWPVTSMRADVAKSMAAGPRRIVRIEVAVHLEIDGDIEESKRAQLERLAKSCPVGQSLNSDIEQQIEFYWTEKSQGE